MTSFGPDVRLSLNLYLVKLSNNLFLIASFSVLQHFVICEMFCGQFVAHFIRHHRVNATQSDLFMKVELVRKFDHKPYLAFWCNHDS